MRNPVISILKAFAISLVVMAHAGSPMYLSRLSYMIGVSLFFVASGYCFSTSYLTQEGRFVARRFKNVYLPFLKWSILLLLLHNLWFYTGILSERYGNASGGVTHPLGLHGSLQAAWSIMFSMSGYDAFLGGAFWFFRSFLVASLLFLFGLKACCSIPRISKPFQGAIVLAVIALFFAYWQTSDGLRWTGMPQGGYRELMGLFFLCIGFLIRQFEQWGTSPITQTSLFKDAAAKEDSSETLISPETSSTSDKVVKWNTITQRLQCSFTKALRIFCDSNLRAIHWLPTHPLAILPFSAAAVAALVVGPHPAMTVRAHYVAEPFVLALSGIVGFYFVYSLSVFLSRVAFLQKVIGYLGDRTLYVFAWHILAFKLAAMLQVGIYDLPWEMIGCHPVIHEPETVQYFWAIYTLVGIAVPLGFLWVYRYCDEHYGLSDYLHWISVTFAAIVLSLKIMFRFITRGARALFIWLALGIRNFFRSFIDIIKESGEFSENEDYAEYDEDEDEEVEYEEDDYEEDEDEYEEDDEIEKEN